MKEYKTCLIKVPCVRQSCFEYLLDIYHIDCLTLQVSEKGEKILPPVGPVLIDDLYLASARKQPVAERMRKMLHSLVEAYKGKGAPPKDGEYSALLKKVGYFASNLLMT